METLIKEFIESTRTGFDYDIGHGTGSGAGSQFCNGNGNGWGYSSGAGSQFYNGTSAGDGVGNGRGCGYGCEYNGDGSDYGDGYGFNPCYDKSISFIDNNKVYMIDDIPTIIESVRNNIAKGYILKPDLLLEPCFIVKENDQFAHGKTLHKAFNDLQEKLYDNISDEERIQKFKKHFIDYNKKYPASEFFTWHHVLTRSCQQGREIFARNHNINILKDFFTVYEFIELTKDNYGGEIIKKLNPRV